MPGPTALPRPRCQCLTSLYEPAAKTPCGMPVPTAPEAPVPTSLFGGRWARFWGPECLTSLSEPARKLAFEACSWRLWRLLPKGVNTMNGASEAPVPLPNVAFWACSWLLWRPLPKRENTMACRAQRRFRGPGASAYVAFWARLKTSLWSLQLTALAAASETGKHHGMPVPTALPKPRCHCLTSLSEPARKLAFEACSWLLWRPLPKRENTMACRFRGPGVSA